MSFNDRAHRDDGEQWDDPEPGSYSVEVLDADCFVSKSGNEIGKATLKITKGAHAGKQFDHILNFGNDVGFGRSKSALIMYGLRWEQVHESPNPWDTLKRLIGGIVGVRAEVTVAVNNGYTNIDVIRAFTADAGVGGAKDDEFVHAPAGAADDDDELPY